MLWPTDSASNVRDEPPTHASAPRRETVAGSGAGDTRSSGSGGSGSVLAVGVRSSSRKDLLRRDRSIVGSFRATWLAKAPMNTHEA